MQNYYHQHSKSTSAVNFAKRRDFLSAIGSSVLTVGAGVLPWLTVGAGSSASVMAAEDPGKFSASVVERIRITRGPKRHRAFPSLLRLKDGALLVFYREGSDHWATNDSVVMLTRSEDGGKTWSKARPLLELQAILGEDNWGFSAHHGALQLSDGSILAPAIAVQRFRGSGFNMRFRAYAMRSHNGGQSWDIQQIGPMPEWTWQNQYGRIIEIDDELWLPGGGQRKGEKTWRTGFFVSHDQGKTWPEWRTVATGLQDEKDILELPDRRLLAMMRSGSTIGSETYRSYSSDRGKTWSKKEKTGLFGQCPSLLLLPSGKILFAFRQVRPKGPMGIGLAVSSNGGQTWREMDPLYVSASGSFDCAYPSMVLGESNEVLCAYYTTFEKGDCHIELARIKVVEGK